MKPEIVHRANRLNLEVKRQGELFFIPLLDDKHTLSKPEIIDTQKRTKSECVKTFFQCLKCGLKHEASEYEQSYDDVMHPTGGYWGHGLPSWTKKQRECKGTSKDMEKRLKLAFVYSPFPSIPEHEQHTATCLGKFDKHITVKGVVRHTNRDHRALNLGDQWHIVAKNEVKQARSVGRGRGAD